MAKNKSNMIGSWAFLAGVVLAVVLGAISRMNTTWAIVLVLIGLVVGLLNVTHKETTPFLMSGVVLIIASAFGGGVLSVLANIPYISVGGIFQALLIIFVPATIIVAIKNVFGLAKN